MPFIERLVVRDLTIVSGETSSLYEQFYGLEIGVIWVWRIVVWNRMSKELNPNSDFPL